MASRLGNEYTDAALDMILGDDHGAAFPSSVWMGLFTTPVGNDTSGDEVSGGGYERIELVNNSTNFPEAEGGLKTIAPTVIWPAAQESWGAISHWGLMDAQSGGNVLFWGRGGGAEPEVVETGDVFRIPAETLTIRIPGEQG